MLVLITNRKSYMSFRLVGLPKSVTLNDLERRNGRDFALFQRIRVPSGRIYCVKVHVSLGLYQILMSSCIVSVTAWYSKLGCKLNSAPVKLYNVPAQESRSRRPNIVQSVVYLP